MPPTCATRPSGGHSRSSDPEYPRPTLVNTTPALDPSPAAQPATPPTAPAVVAVVVARDPGDWFEETMASLAEQDYPNLSILVIDAGSSTEIKGRVGGATPGALVRPINENVGYGAAANEVR